MKALKVYNLATGWFYGLYGLYGLLAPNKIAELMGWDIPGLLGAHQIRALWAVSAASGIAIIMAALKQQDQRPLGLLMIFFLLAFATGRLLGLVLDGIGPMQTYYELGFEIFWSALGYILYRRAKTG